MKLVIKVLSRLIPIPILIFTITSFAQSKSDQQILLRKVGAIPPTHNKVRTLATYPLNYDAQVITYRNLFMISVDSFMHP